MKPKLPSKWVKGVATDEPVYLAARFTLAGRLHSVQTLFELAAERSQESVEFVHLLRVWTRRASTALELSRDQIPRRIRKKAAKLIKRIRKSANRARDCDVQIQRLEKSIKQLENPVESIPSEPTGRISNDLMFYQHWLEQIKLEREEAQLEMQSFYRKLKRRDRMANLFQKLICKIKSEGQKSRRPFREWALKKMKSQTKIFFRTFPDDPNDTTALHQFRIHGKSLRYSIEVVALSFPPELKEQVYPKLIKLQDILGDLNDLEVARGQLEIKQCSARNSQERAMWRKIRKKKTARLKRKTEQFYVNAKPRYLKPLQSQLNAIFQPLSG